MPFLRLPGLPDVYEPKSTPGHDATKHQLTGVVVLSPARKPDNPVQCLGNFPPIPAPQLSTYSSIQESALTSPPLWKQESFYSSLDEVQRVKFHTNPDKFSGHGDTDNTLSPSFPPLAGISLCGINSAHNNTNHKDNWGILW